MRPDGIPEPRVVAHRHQQCGLGQIQAHRAPERDLVADRHSEHVRAEPHRFLLGGTVAEVGHPDPERRHHRTEHGHERHVLPERDEAALEVEPGLGSEHRHRVQVGAPGSFAHRDTGDDRAAVPDGLLPQTARELQLRIEKSGNRRFRPDHEVRVEVLPGEPRVPLQRRRPHLRTPLDVLVDVALNDCRPHRRPRRFHPVDSREPEPRSPQHRRRDEQPGGAPVATQHRQGETAGHERDQGAGAVHPQHRQPSRGGAVDLRVSDLQPWESGKRPSSEPLPQRPCRGVYRQHPGRFARRRDAHHDPAEHGGIERKTCDEPHRQRECQRSHHVGELEALVHPGDAGAERAEPEQPAAEESEARCRASVPREKQRGKGRERDGIESERSERERQNGPGREASARDGGLADASTPA